MHASNWAPIGVKLMDFRQKSDVNDVGSLFEPICGRIMKKSFFFDLLTSQIISKSGPMQIHVEAQPKYTCACEDPSETCVNCRENMIRKRALRQVDDVGSLLHVLGCLLGSIFFLEENAVLGAWYNQNTAKFHHTCHKMGSNRGVIGPIWRKKWCG